MQSNEKAEKNADQPAITKSYWLALVVLLILTAVARSWTSFDLVYQDNAQAKLLGVDPYFHLRHSQQVIQDFPVIDRHDKLTHFPKGTKNDAAGMFNLLIASTTILIYGQQASIEQIAEVSVWLAFSLGCLATILLFLLSQRLLGNTLALFATVLFTLFPATFLDRASFGFADQHVAEVCLALLLTYGLVKLLTIENNTTTKLTTAIIAFILLAYTWIGSILYLPIIACCLLVYLTVLCQQQKQLNQLKWDLIKFSLLTFAILLVVKFAIPWLTIAPQPGRWLLYGTFGLGVCAWGYITLLERFPLNKRGTIALINLTIIFICSTVLMQIEIKDKTIADVLFAKRDLLVTEHKDVDFNLWLWQLGLSGLLIVVGTVNGLFLMVKQRLNPATCIPLFMGIAWLFLWYQSGDFGYLISPFCAFIAALSLYQLKHQQRNIALACCTLASIILLWPSLKLTRPPWLTQAQANSLVIYPQGWFEAAKWLKQNSPAIEWHKNRANYGVITSWDFGNIIASHGERVPRWSRYPSKTIPNWLTAQTEQQAQQWLCPKCRPNQSIDYAIVDAQSYGGFFATKAKVANLPMQVIKQANIKLEHTTIPKMTFDHHYDNAMVTRLYANDGRDLAHYRLVYETQKQHFVTSHLQLKGNNFDFHRLSMPINTQAQLNQYQQYAKADVVISGGGYLYDGEIYPSVKIYQIVPGAKIGGKAPEGTQVKAQLRLKVKSTGREFIYSNTTIATKQNRYQLIVPYPTTDSTDKVTPPLSIGQSDVEAQSAYQLLIKRPDDSQFEPHGEFNISLQQIYQQ